MRGKRIKADSSIFRVRLIPACAGKTESWSHRAANPEAHPRVCGENCARRIFPHCRLGSSPRVRGKPTHGTTRANRGRLIPACAGKTTRRRKTPRRLRAHPRVCGENYTENAPVRSRTGSSPRVRGKLPSIPCRISSARLIPACAGKTNRFHSSISPSRGSSPRVRGKHPTACPGRYHQRLIPACAGKTTCPASRSRI